MIRGRTSFASVASWAIAVAAGVALGAPVASADDAATARARARVAAGDYLGARKELVPSPGDPGRSDLAEALDLYGASKTELRDDAVRGARALLERTGGFPKNLRSDARAWALLTVGEALFAEGKLRDALGPLERAQIAAPDLAVTHAAVGEVHLRWRQKKYAEPAFEAALRLDPRCGRAIAGQAWMRFLDRDREAAFAQLDAGLAERPDDPFLHHTRGVLILFGSESFDAEQLELAEKAFRKAMVVQPRNAELHTMVGLTLSTRRRHVEAVAPFQRAVKLDPSNVARRIQLARELGSANRFGEALVEFKAAAKLDIADPDDWEIGIWIAKELGQPDIEKDFRAEQAAAQKRREKGGR